MSTIQTVINLWLTYSSFIREFKKYYDEHHDITGNVQYDINSIREALPRRCRICSDTDIPDTYYVDNKMDNISLAFSKMFKTGCYVTATEQGYKFVLHAEYENETYTQPLYKILNDFLGEEYFTDSIFSRNWSETDEILMFMFDFMSTLQEYSGLYLCRGLYAFLTETEFIKEYTTIVKKYARDDDLYGRYKPAKEDILSLVAEFGFTGKYNKKERFCHVEKERDGVEIGFNIAFSYDFITFIPFADKDNHPLFFAPSFGAVVNLLSKENVHSLSYHSEDELRDVMGFMFGYLDTMIRYLRETE